MPEAAEKEVPEKEVPEKVVPSCWHCRWRTVWLQKEVPEKVVPSFWSILATTATAQEMEDGVAPEGRCVLALLVYD